MPSFAGQAGGGVDKGIGGAQVPALQNGGDGGGAQDPALQNGNGDRQDACPTGKATATCSGRIWRSASGPANRFCQGRANHPLDNRQQ